MMKDLMQAPVVTWMSSVVVSWGACVDGKGNGESYVGDGE